MATVQTPSTAVFLRFTGMARRSSHSRRTKWKSRTSSKSHNQAVWTNSTASSRIIPSATYNPHVTQASAQQMNTHRLLFRELHSPPAVGLAATRQASLTPPNSFCHKLSDKKRYNYYQVLFRDKNHYTLRANQRTTKKGMIQTWNAPRASGGPFPE